MYNQKPLSGDLLDYGDWSTDGLAGLWLFNEGSGKIVFDLSGNGNGGVFSGDVSWGTGKYGSIVSIGSSQDRVLCSGAAKLFNPIEGTIELFVKPNWDYDDGLNHHLFSTTGGSGRVFSLYKRSTGVTRLTTDSTNRGNPTITWQSGQYYHVFVVWGTNKLYINNVLVNDYDDGGLGDGSDDLVIGDHETPNTEQAWDGDIEWVRVWNRALSASEIALLYREPFRMIRTRRRRIIYDEIAAVPPTASPYYYREIASRRIA